MCKMSALKVFDSHVEKIYVHLDYYLIRPGVKNTESPRLSVLASKEFCVK